MNFMNGVWMLLGIAHCGGVLVAEESWDWGHRGVFGGRGDGIELKVLVAIVVYCRKWEYLTHSLY